MLHIIHTKQSKTRSPVSAFSLIELLVTISIIAILMGIIVPVYSSMRENARYAAAKTTAKNLELAFRAYLDHYKVWKFTIQGDEQLVADQLVQVLRGENTGSANPDEIVFYEFTDTNVVDKAIDPWYYLVDQDRDDRVYRVSFDRDYNNYITRGNDKIYRPVIVWSLGPPGKEDQIITSW